MSQEKNDWMVIGYSKAEGEYPVQFNMTKTEAMALVAKNNSSNPLYPDRIQKMDGNEANSFKQPEA